LQIAKKNVSRTENPEDIIIGKNEAKGGI